jgi:hypothetical protein
LGHDGQRVVNDDFSQLDWQFLHVEMFPVGFPPLALPFQGNFCIEGLGHVCSNLIKVGRHRLP